VQPSRVSSSGLIGTTSNLSVSSSDLTNPSFSDSLLFLASRSKIGRTQQQNTQPAIDKRMVMIISDTRTTNKTEDFDCAVERNVGHLVGLKVGCVVGSAVGGDVGHFEGSKVGCVVGSSVGGDVGGFEGGEVGFLVGCAEGDRVGIDDLIQITYSPLVPG